MAAEFKNSSYLCTVGGRKNPGMLHLGSVTLHFLPESGQFSSCRSEQSAFFLRLYGSRPAVWCGLGCRRHRVWGDFLLFGIGQSRASVGISEDRPTLLYLHQAHRAETFS